MYHSKSGSNRLGVWLSVAVLSMSLSCGGPPPQIMITADRDETFWLAEKSNFQYCNVKSNKLCASPDGKLVFHMPLNLLISKEEPAISDLIVITNDGPDPIIIDEYRITITDDLGNFYRPEFLGPGGYNSASTMIPALTVHPSPGTAEIRFWTNLKSGSKTIKSISIFYRADGEDVFTQIVVSYLPLSYFDS